MIPVAPAGYGGALVLWDCEGNLVQYSLQDVEVAFRTSGYEEDRIEISAVPGGENFVDLSNRRDEELTLLLELWGEQRRLGASDEALAATRTRIEQHIKEEA